MKLLQEFFEKDTIKIAKNLIGKVLTYETKKGAISGIINETEAYTEEDEASHTYGGKNTPRTKTMFEKGGHLYVYFTYGMHYCCNVVTEKKDRGCAVLIRSVIPINGIEIMKEARNYKPKDLKNLTNGPAKLCQAYGINKKHNGINLVDKDSKIYIEDLGHKPRNIENTKRIGISRGKDKIWRFFCKEF